MAKTTADLWFRFFSDTKSLDKGTRQARTNLSKTEKAASAATRGFSGMQRALGSLGLALGAREIGQWAYEATQMAETAQIAAASADKALGPAAQRLRNDFENLRLVMGMNRGEFDQLIATQGLMVTGLGASQDAAGKLIGELITLGGDLATFKGDVGSTAVAIDDVTAAIRGEFDPLEKWGVKLNEAKIKAKITQREGTDPLFASLSEGEKRLIAITELIEEGAAPAIGSLGDAAATAAGQTNEMNTRLDDMQIEIGTLLLPAMVELTTWTLGYMRAATEAGKSTNRWNEAVALAVRFTGDWLSRTTVLGLVIRANIDRINSWGRSIRTAYEWVARLISKIRQIPSSIRNPFASWRMPKLNIPGFATGGTVPGPIGAPQLAVVHGGEEIRTPSQQRQGSGAGGSVTINVDASFSDPQAIAQRLVDLLRIYNRTQGAVPIIVEGGIG